MLSTRQSAQVKNKNGKTKMAKTKNHRKVHKLAIIGGVLGLKGQCHEKSFQTETVGV